MRAIFGVTLVSWAMVVGCGGSGGSGSESPSGGSSGSPSVGPVCEAPEQHQGEGTFYDADGRGNCSFPADPGLMVAAMNQADYAGSAACGACAKITGPSGEVTVRIVDRCPECKPGDIDLSEEAFVKIAARSAGRVPISWHYTACEVQGPIVYHYKDGSSQWWTSLQVRNHAYPIAKLEAGPAGGELRELPRANHNYFTADKGLGLPPYHFRLTDVNGEVIEDLSVAGGDDTSVSGGSQFPVCRE